MEDEMLPLSDDDSFCFSCSKELDCFNECCRDLNQFLTPYDVLRIKNRLNNTSTEFLKKYAALHIGPETGLPVATLKPDSSPEMKCPFVTESGCSIYEDRPASCRTYPVARLASRSRETGIISEHYMLIKESHCHGFEQDKTWTVKDWIEDQEIAVYNQMNDMFMELISLKNRLMPGQMDLKDVRMFQLVCYDLDSFRSHIFEKGFLNGQDIDAETKEKIKESDEELLKFGIGWIKTAVFGNK